MRPNPEALTLPALALRWSGVDRAQRYRRRNGGEGGEPDDSNPLPDLIDPITLEPVVTPAISPFGHVMGLATWKARHMFPVKVRVRVGVLVHLLLTSASTWCSLCNQLALPHMGRVLAPTKGPWSNGLTRGNFPSAATGPHA